VLLVPETIVPQGVPVQGSLQDAFVLEPLKKPLLHVLVSETVEHAAVGEELE
jgi:hypothetical protein